MHVHWPAQPTLLATCGGSPLGCHRRVTLSLGGAVVSTRIFVSSLVDWALLLPADGSLPSWLLAESGLVIGDREGSHRMSLPADPSGSSGMKLEDPSIFLERFHLEADELDDLI